MAYIDFSQWRDLSPAAFKLYVYFLHRVHTRNQAVFTLSLAQLGWESGLQAPGLYPSLRHGKDGQLRRALQELIDRGLIEKHGQRGKRPNTYRVLEPSGPPLTSS